MNTKKYITFSILLVLVALLTACDNTPVYDESSAAPIAEKEAADDMQEDLSFSLSQPKSLDEVIEGSYFILRCAFRSKGDASEGIDLYKYSNYTFEYIEPLMGMYDKEEIEVLIFDYEAFNNSGCLISKPGIEYVLFLEKRENIFTGTEYTLSGGLFFEVSSINITSAYQRGNAETFLRANDGIQISTTDELTDKIAGIADDIADNNEDAVLGNAYILSESPEEIVGFSQQIAEVEVVQLNSASTEWKSAAEEYWCKTMLRYKGDVPSYFYVHVFKGELEAGKKYLLLLSGSNEPYTISSLNSCIPLEDTQLYDEYMQYIDSN